jgi:hypothetical protein
VREVRFGIGWRVALVFLAALALGAPTPAEADSPIGLLDCDSVEHRDEREEVDFRGQRSVLTTTGCFRDGAPVAFLHQYVVAPPIQPLVEADDPAGSGLTVVGDDWRLDLAGEISEDRTLATHLAASTNGRLARRLSPLLCIVHHPDPAQQT